MGKDIKHTEEISIVPYKIAKLLKKKGFNEPYSLGGVRSLYDNKKDHVAYLNFGFYTGYSSDGGYIDAPLYQQVLEWLKTKLVHITSTPNCVGKKFTSWNFDIVTYKTGGSCYKSLSTQFSYKEGLDKAIEMALKLI
jgi:hypothetical protein